MIAHDITNITPTLDDTGRLVRIQFTATASDGAGNAESLAVDLSGGFPLPAAGYIMAEASDGSMHATALCAAYTSDEITALCWKITDERNIFPHMDSAVMSQTTPVFAPSSIAPVELSDLQKKTIWMQQIDNNIAFVTERFTRFQLAYEQREAAAKAFKAAGYSGDPTSWISRYADNVSISYRAAADLILSQAGQLRAALQQLENLRMDKYRVMNAATIADAETEFNTIIAGASQIGRGLQ